METTSLSSYVTIQGDKSLIIEAECNLNEQNELLNEKQQKYIAKLEETKKVFSPDEVGEIKKCLKQLEEQKQMIQINADNFNDYFDISKRIITLKSKLQTLPQ